MLFVDMYLPVRDGRPPISAQSGVVKLCERDISQIVADMARAAFPDTLPSTSRSLKRNAFVRSRAWDLFDIDRNGRLSFDEYLSMEWAGYLAQLPSGQCLVTRHAFLVRYLGDEQDKLSGWRVPYQQSVFENIYKSLDRDNKGHISKADIRDWSRRSFDRLDVGHKGYLVPSDL